MEQNNTKNGVKNTVRPQNKHLIPFKKGENMGSHRPKGSLNYSTIRELAIRQLGKLNNKTPLEIDIEIQANALLEARKGNFQFYKDDKDRMYGQATQKQDVTSGGKELKVIPAHLLKIAEKYEQELRDQL